MFRIISFALLGLGLLSGCVGSGASLPEVPATTGPYTLDSGDRLRVTIVPFEPTTETYVVDDTGSVSMPLIGVVPVRAKTTAEVEQAIRGRLAADRFLKDASVNVQVERYRPFFILGEVARPGQYDYVPGMSVLTAVAIAGGFTFRAQTDYVSVTRNTDDGAAMEGKAERNTVIRPGDTIFVFERIL